MAFPIKSCLFLVCAQMSCVAVAQANTATTNCQPMIDVAQQHIYQHEKVAAEAAIAELPDINCKSSSGSTVLLVVSSLPDFNDSTIYDEILSRHPNLESTDRYGLTAMYYAGFHGKIDLLDKLIKLTDKKHIGRAASIALLGASQGNQKTAEQYLLAIPDLDVDLADSAGMTSLFFGAMNSSVTLIDSLLQRGANPNLYETDSGNTPLLWAAQGTPDAVEILLRNTDARQRNPYTCESVMHVAVRKINVPVVRLLLSRGVRADGTDGFGNTPLGVAKGLEAQLGKDDSPLGIEERQNNLAIEKLLTAALVSKGMNVRDSGTPTANCTDENLRTLPNTAGLGTYIPSQPVDLPLGLRPDDFVALAARVVQRWTAQKHILLNVRTPDFISFQFFVFAATLCNPQHAPPSRMQPCSKLLHDDLTLQQMIVAELDDTFVRQLDRVPLLSATLSKQIGIDLSRARLPIVEPNHTSCFGLPREYGNNVAYWLDADFPVRILPGHKLCGVADTYHVVLPEKKLELDIDVDRNTTPKKPQITFRVVNGVSKLEGRRVSMPSLMFCPNQKTNDGPRTKPIPGRDDVVIVTPASFSKTQGVLIKIVDDSATCRQECPFGFEKAIMQAILLWRSSCSRCQPDSALVIRVGDTTYVNSKSIDIMFAQLESGKPLIPKQNERSPKESNPFSSVYKQFDPNEQKIEALCRADATELPFLCKGPFDVGAALKLEIRVSEKSDACDRDDAIACANPTGLILLRALNHRFMVTGVLNTDTHFVFGDKGSTFDLVTVLAHEIGHFFGVPHVESVASDGLKADIMRASYAPHGSCITSSDTNMLDNAVDPRWPFRLVGCAGLRDH